MVFDWSPMSVQHCNLQRHVVIAVNNAWLPVYIFEIYATFLYNSIFVHEATSRFFLEPLHLMRNPRLILFWLGKFWWNKTSRICWKDFSINEPFSSTETSESLDSLFRIDKSMFGVCGKHFIATTMNITQIPKSRNPTYPGWITKSVIPKRHFSPTSLLF